MSTQAWKKLHGIFCIYKPPNYSHYLVKNTLMRNLANDLNEKFEPEKENLITIEGSTSSEMSLKVSEKLAVHPLAIGPGFVKGDLKLKIVDPLPNYSSGVCLVGVNKAKKFATVIAHSRLIRTYRVSGLLGKSTNTLHVSGRVIEKSKYHHVTHRRIEKILMTIQASHQKKAMQYIGAANLDSQLVYNLLSQEGLIRPGTDSQQLLYSLNCIDFEPPNFTIEVACINETEYQLWKLVHDIGLLLKTNATANKTQRIRYGPFNVDDALLLKHWRLDDIVENMNYLRPRFNDIVPKSASLQQLESSVS